LGYYTTGTPPIFNHIIYTAQSILLMYVWDLQSMLLWSTFPFLFTSSQWMVDGRHGHHGLSVKARA